jgi:MFS superfamily sulfate permease-like transporter
MSAPNLKFPAATDDAAEANARDLHLVRGGPDLSFRAVWRNDLKSGLVVFLVAVPLCLGVALASGAPLFSGIVTGIVGGLIVSHLSGSPLMVSGPAAGLTAIVLSAITSLGSFEIFLSAVVLAGLMQIVLRLLRAGIIAWYFPSPVIRGMLAGIGLILILKQLPYALGVGSELFEATEFWTERGNTFSVLVTALAAIQPGTLLISAAALLLLVLWERPAFKRAKGIIPAPLLVVLVGVALNFAYRLVAPSWAIGAEGLVNLPLPDPDAGIGNYLRFPDWSGVTQPAVWTVAVTLALVASLETLLSLDATEKLDPYKRRVSGDRELLAQGIGNTISGLLGGLPMTGVIVRSAANVSAGGKTKWSAFSHGVLLLVAVLLIPSTLNQIPLATLAAILLHTGFKLAHPRLFRDAYRQGFATFAPFTITIVAILLTDLLRGIGIGLTVGAFFILLEHSKRAYSYKREDSDDRHVVRITLSEHVSFLNKAAITQLLHGLPRKARVTVDATKSAFVDPDVVELLHDFREESRTREIDLTLIGVPAPAGVAAAH